MLAQALMKYVLDICRTRWGCHSAFFPIYFKGAFLHPRGWKGVNYISQSSLQLGFWAQSSSPWEDSGEKGGRGYIKKRSLLVCVRCWQLCSVTAPWLDGTLEQLLWSLPSWLSAAPVVALIPSLHTVAMMAAAPGGPVQLCCLGVTPRAQPGSSSLLSVATFSSNIIVSAFFPYETPFCFQELG